MKQTLRKIVGGSPPLLLSRFYIHPLLDIILKNPFNRSLYYVSMAGKWRTPATKIEATFSRQSDRAKQFDPLGAVATLYCFLEMPLVLGLNFVALRKFMKSPGIRKR